MQLIVGSRYQYEVFERPAAHIRARHFCVVDLQSGLMRDFFITDLALRLSPISKEFHIQESIKRLDPAIGLYWGRHALAGGVRCILT